MIHRKMMTLEGETEEIEVVVAWRIVLVHVTVSHLRNTKVLEVRIDIVRDLEMINRLGGDQHSFV